MAPPASALPIDIIVPVYRGLAETRACLESVFGAMGACSRPRELVVVDDCSPEPEISSWLRELARAGRITLLTQPENRGFVASVNRGMSLHPDRDVILLNSDTEVTGDWVDRLAAAAAGADVATVTPFSNNATICSYPRFCKPSELPRGETLATLDAVFRQTNRGASVDLPTGVGFCLYIRRAALERLGLFDVQSFGRGYGEENDFCRRAAKAGLRNLLAADVFVLHRGGVSFGATQSERMSAGAEKLRQLHPEYAGVVDRFCRADPARPLRHAASVARLRASPRPRLLFVTHRAGGGVEKHVRELAAFVEASAEVLLLRPHGAGNLGFSLEWARAGEDLALFFDREGELMRVLQAIGVSRVHVHHALGLAIGPETLSAKLGVPFDFTIHDYLAICPRLHLSGTSESYCGEPDAQGCASCLGTKPFARVGGSDIVEWRRSHRRLVEDAERVLAPSRDAGLRLLRYFPSARVRLAPHLDSEFPAPLAGSPGSGPLRVALLGLLDEKKGASVLRDVAQAAQDQKAPIEFHLIGRLSAEWARKAAPRPWIEHGSYADDEELDLKLARSSPHLAWFPARVPETYSYVLSAALRNALPVMATDLGAFSERLAGRAWSWVAPKDTRPEEWVRLLLAAGESLRSARWPAGSENPTAGGLPAFDYARDYLPGVNPQAGSSLPLVADALRAFAYDPADRTGGIWTRALLSLQHSRPAQRMISALSPDQRDRIKRLIFQKKWVRAGWRCSIPATKGQLISTGRRLILPALFCLLTLALSFIDVIRGWWDHDSGYYLLVSSYISSGLIPYRDFELMYTPLVPYVGAIPYVLGVPPGTSAMLIPMVWIAANTAVTYFLIRAWTNRHALALLLSGLFPLFCIDNGGNHVTLEHGIILFSSLALTLAIQAPLLQSGVLAGAAFALALLSKQVAVVGALSLVFIGFFHPSFSGGRARKLCAVLAGFLVPFTPLLLSILVSDSSDLLATDLHASASYFSRYVASSTDWDLGFVLGEFRRSPFSAYLVLLALALGALVIASGPQKGDRLLVATLLVSILAYLLARASRNYPHYSLNAWPYIALTIALACHRLGRSAHGVAGAAALLMLIAYGAQFRSLQQAGYFSRWKSGSTFHTALLPAAQEIDRLLPPGEKFLQIGDYAELEMLTGRFPRNLSRNYGHCFDPRKCENYYDFLGPLEDPWVVVVDIGQPGLAPKRAQLEDSGYRLLKRVDGDPRLIVEIWRRFSS